MPRLEFNRKTRAAIIKRAAGKCEACEAPLKPGEGEVDHILPDALGGKPDAGNGRLICRICHKAKTAADIGQIRKADRARDKSTGAVRPAGKLANRGFPKSQKPKPPSRPPVTRVRDVFGRPIARTAT